MKEAILVHLLTSNIQTRIDFSLQREQKDSYSCQSEINLRTVPTIVIAHTFCASPDTRTPIANAY